MSIVGKLYLCLRCIVVKSMLAMYDFKLAVLNSSFDHVERIIFTLSFPTNTDAGVSSSVPPSMYLCPSRSTVANNNGTAIVIHRASTTDIFGLVSHEKYSVRHKFTQYALMCNFGIVGRS